MYPKSGSEATLRPLLILFIVITLTGCGLRPPEPPTPTQTLIPTFTPTFKPTFTPTLPPTNTPIPTATMEPTSTAIPLPEGISEIVSNASIKYQDKFENSLNFPNGWAYCTRFDAVWSGNDGHLAVSSKKGNYGTIFYFADQMIYPNQAVYFLFAYTGNENDISLGFDGYDNGKVCSSTNSKLGFYSVALQHMPGLPLTIHSLTSAGLKTSYFEGDWRLQDLNWYSILMGYDQSNTFFMDIWKPGNPNQKLVFKQTYADFPKAYNFISWVSASRTVLIDDFTIITFDKIQ
jgi:hypothetical protein